jgi:hypothetical protein
MVKYKQQIKEMLEIHHALFASFKDIHDKYVAEPKKYQQLFNQEGEKILPIIRRYENGLCSKSESGKYGKFSNTLADKFWAEIRSLFPKIDYIGLQ